jgi:hypothetical protein
MSNEPNDEVFVAADTDDLDAFTDLMSGKAQPVKEEDVKPEKNVDPLSENDQEADDVSEDDDDDQSTDEAEEVKPVKKVNRAQERINQLLERERVQKERAEALAAEVAALRQAAEPASKTAPVSTVPEGPHPDDQTPEGTDKYPLGEYDPAYIRDLTRFTIQKETEAAKQLADQEAAQRQHKEAIAALQTEWEGRLAPVTEQHADFMEKTLELEDAFEGLDPQYSDYLVNTIKSLDHGPEVLYYFANNLEEAKSFVKMGPLGATLALGEINAMFKGQTRKETKLSKAPPPPQINKGAKTRAAVSDDTDDLDAFAAKLFSR